MRNCWVWPQSKEYLEAAEISSGFYFLGSHLPSHRDQNTGITKNLLSSSVPDSSENISKPIGNFSTY